MSEFSLRCAWLLLAGLAAGNAVADSGSRLLATGGVTQVEGSAGGGLTPWALIAGYGSNEQVHGTAYFTKVTPKDFDLESVGAAVGIYNRLELSFARQHFGLGSTVPGQTIDQQIVGAKLRLLGDAVFSPQAWLPQVAVGVLHKRTDDAHGIPLAVGAAIYVSQYASRRAREILKPAIELLASIPSVVLGFFEVGRAHV